METSSEQQSLLSSHQHTVVNISESSRQGRLIPEESEERCCRICLGTTDNRLSQEGKLISPCLCKGTSRYIHLGCLQTWREMSPKKESSYRCDTCHYHYSLARPWIANVLENPWFQNIVTLIMFLALWIGAAYGGHALDEKDIWQWKKLKYLNGRQRPVNTVLGLDWWDIVWGLTAVGCVGLLFLIVLGCKRCCASRWESRGRGGGGSSSGPSFIYIGDCGSSSESCDCGEAALIVFFVGLILLG